MWMEKLDDNKYKFFERYTDPYTEKYRKVSVTLTSGSSRAKKEAQKMLDKKIDEKLKTINLTGMTFKEALKKWYKIYEHTVKPKTALRTNMNINIILKLDSMKQDVLLKKIDPSFIQSALEDIYYKQEYSYSVTKQCKAIFSNLFSYYTKSKIINENPALDIEIKQKPKTINDIEKIENKYLERDELRNLINYQQKKKNARRNGLMTEFLSLTGMRYGEMVALTEKDINEDYIFIRGTLDYHTNSFSEAVKDTTKTKNSYRKIITSERINEIIKEITFENKIREKTIDGYKKSDFIFTSSNGNPVSIGIYNTALSNAASKLDIKKHVSSHILRHTHISLLAEAGIPLKAIMDRVGHSKAETTLSIYTHITKDMNEQVKKALDDISK